MTNTYRVSWLIDVEADTPREAVEKALKVQRDSSSNATVFQASRHSDETGRHLEGTWTIDPENYSQADEESDPWKPGPKVINTYTKGK